MNIGEKIRAERLRLKITQNDLCADKITRNMLSAIECGRANPSLDTLSYIASRLSVPLSYLVSDGAELSLLEKANHIDRIKTAYADERFADCISLIEELTDLDDELCLMLAYSYFNVGRASLFAGALKSAMSQLNSCRRYCGSTIYDTSRLEAVLPIYLAVATNLQSPLLELDRGFMDANEYFTQDLEFYRYISLDLDYKYTTPLFERHTMAKRLMRERNYVAALDILKKIEAQKSAHSYNSYAFFSVYCDMENCYKYLGDFENAYRYSSKRLSMLEGFKS